MANLVTNLGGQEGGQVGLESLLQTYEKMKEQKIYLILRCIFFIEVNVWQVNYLQIILI